MNQQFEQNVNTSLEKAEYNPNITVQPSPQQKINRSFNRKLILLFTGAVICFALMIIIRGVLLQNPALYDNSSIIGQILNPNGATGLDGLDLTEAQTIVNDFTNNLKEEYQMLPNNEYRTLVFKTNNSSIIGNLQYDGSFKEVKKIPNIIQMYRYYNDSTYLYSINSPNIGLSELYLNTVDNKPVMLRRLDKDQKFIDAHFSILDKTFYFSFYDENNTVYIQAVDLKGTQYQLYKTNFLKTETKIWNVDTSSGYIYLNQGRECFSLQLRDKVLDSYACEKIKMNTSNNFYWANESNTGFYTSFDKGVIYRFTRGELERKVLTSKNNGQIVQKLSLSGDNMYYLTGNLIPSGSTLWNIQPEGIQYVNVMNTQVNSIEIKNMRSDIHSIIPFNDLYITTEEFFGESKLYMYIEDPDLSVPASYASYPTSYVVNLADLYWKEVELGFDYKSVDVVEAQYTFDY